MARWQVTIDRLAGDRIVGNWEHGKASELLEQLGAPITMPDPAERTHTPEVRLVRTPSLQVG